MTTAPKLIREQLLSLADKWREIAYSFTDTAWNSPNGHSNSARRSVFIQCAMELESSLSAEPVGGEVPGWRFDAREDGTIMVVSRSGAACVVAPDGWKRSVTGHVLYELIRDIESGARPDSAEGDTWPTESELMDDLDNLRATDEGKGERSCCDDALPGHSLDCPERFQPKAEAGEWVTRESALEAIEHVNAHNGPGREREAISMLSAAPQPESDSGASYVHPDGDHYKNGGAWPFVESPGEFADRMRQAFIDFNGDWLAAVRNVLIENRPTLSTATQPEQPARDGDALVEGLRRTIADLDPAEGRWVTCTGCYESEDGHPIGEYPHSDLLNCTLGGGCSECGGMGAIWDTTDYADFAEFTQPPQQADGCLGLVASAFNYLGDFPAIDEAWVTNWRNRAEAFLSQQADGGAVAWWLDSRSESVISAELKQANPQYTDWDIPLYAAPPKSPGVGVDDAMVERAHAAYWSTEEDRGDDKPAMRSALLAALGGEK